MIPSGQFECLEERTSFTLCFSGFSAGGGAQHTILCDKKMITAGLNSERDENKSAKNITFIPALFSCFRTLEFFVLVDIWVTTD